MYLTICLEGGVVTDFEYLKQVAAKLAIASHCDSDPDALSVVGEQQGQPVYTTQDDTGDRDAWAFPVSASLPDIRSVWLARPDPEGVLATDFLGVHAEACVQPDGSTRWAIRSGSSQVLGKDGVWILEPQPSNRDTAFYQEYRFDTLDEATAFYRAGPQEEP